jgi:predicted ATP-dependent endonuclease of OLD family
MRITNVEIKNFRLLENVNVALDEDITLIVGRNNSGKTSVIEVFNNFFGEEVNTFRFEDLSVEAFALYYEALDTYREFVEASEELKDELESKFKSQIPFIELSVLIEYEDSDDGYLAALSEFILDLDTERKDAMIRCRYMIKDPNLFFKKFEAEKDDYDNDILSFVKANFSTLYSTRYFAVDKEDSNNYKEIEKISKINDVFTSKYIYAQRNLDDQAKDKNKRLSKGFEDYYRLNKDHFAKNVKGIERLLKEFSDELDKGYEKFFEGIFKDLGQFGVDEGINLQELIIKSLFEPEKILKGNTQLFYNHEAGELPESYNGLGYSNLIYMILQFISFYESFDKRDPRPNFQLVFIEEPEAHLHPQMQHVFIKNIKDFIDGKENWNVQVIITTHSSHIVEESNFSNIRYFDNSDETLLVKNLSDFKHQEDAKDEATVKFLKQYLTLKNCDMFFADKIIMVEGTVERLLLPEMIKRDHSGLTSKYLSIIEVGGAYAHRFKAFLKFINVKTLIITDIDSINSSESNKSCRVQDGDKTSNAVLKNWLPQKESIDDLVKLTPDDKVDENGKVRVAYQVPEVGEDKKECGRSFEDAFILKNAKALSDNETGEIIKKLINGKTEDEIRSEAFDLAEVISKKFSKTDFAFDVLLMKDWETPKYISEGLTWLEKDIVQEDE